MMEVVDNSSSMLYEDFKEEVEVWLKRRMEK